MHVFVFFDLKVRRTANTAITFILCKSKSYVFDRKISRLGELTMTSNLAMVDIEDQDCDVLCDGFCKRKSTPVP